MACQGRGGAGMGKQAVCPGQDCPGTGRGGVASGRPGPGEPGRQGVEKLEQHPALPSPPLPSHPLSRSTLCPPRRHTLAQLSAPRPALSPAATLFSANLPGPSPLPRPSRAPSPAKTQTEPLCGASSALGPWAAGD